jgi:hypothetical protein
MPEPAAVPVPEPASPMGDIFAQYQPGQQTDLFAPAYIKGYAPAEAALSKWNAYNHNVAPGMIDELRMPNEYQGPSPMSGGNGVYGGPIPLKQTYGDPKGQIDVEALRAMSQGGHYDVEGRRNAIAARLAANAVAATPATAPVELGRGFSGERDPLQDQLDELNKRMNALNTAHD